MKDKLRTLLETLGYEAYEQGSFTSEEEYPNSFFTYWNYDTDSKYYSNKAYLTIWSFWVNFYSNDPTLVESVMNAAVELLLENNYVVKGKGNDVASGSKHHSGRELNVYFIEKN